MLWIDKYQPRYLRDLRCNRELNDLLVKITSNSNGNIPHLLFYGPSGGGKKVRISAVLHEIFGDSVDKVKADMIKPEGTNSEFVLCQSPHHMQISAPDLGTKDGIVTQYLIKQLSSQMGASSFFSKGPSYRVFTILEADVLSLKAQAGLRRTMEKYSNNSRLILHCEQLSSIIPPLRSRCLCIRVPLPSPDEVLQVLRHISNSENLQVSTNYLEQIVKESDCNLRRAILILETAYTQSFSNPPSALKLPWQKVCIDIATSVVKNPHPKTLLDAREPLYDLLCSCIPADLILVTLTKHLLSIVSASAHPIIINAAAHYAHTLKLGNKDIWHIEAFLAQVMNCHKHSK
ncbi:putative replication factor C subunit 5 [Cryptosporidium canis]|uniref:Replication factor C subunit 5 n=1 Tax=Cryptosporidium canis TaxID=195482 RepID=A0A9D5DIC3_9CRYT|nr:putative replication factor C subunit 5 [Cryptosporidium canis]